jgi:uncharacterized membrane protein
MNATGSSDRSIVVPLLVLGVAVAAAWVGAGAIWLLVAFGAATYIAWQVRGSNRSRAASRLTDRVEFLERRVAELQRTVNELRSDRPERTAAPTPSPAPPARPARPPQPAAEAPRPPRATEPEPVPVMPPPLKAPAAKGFDWGRTVATADLMGAKALAFAGGVVTLLGVVFFFVLAVNRGWIGPGMRIACGGVASSIVFGAGLWLQRRYETTYSALAAVGAGIAGAYATLLAAGSLYDMVSEPVALVIAAAIASLGVAVSLAWSAEVVAGFGLIGAMIVPATLFFQGGLQELGTAFVAVVFAGAVVVAVRERWWTMLQVGSLVSVPQALAQFTEAGAPHAGIVSLATVFWLLYLAAGLAFQLRLGGELAAAPATFLTGGAVFAGVSAALLYGQRHDGLQQGIALLIVASVYVAVAAALFRRARELATLLWALGLTAGAVGLAQALSGSSLTYAWAAEAALLVWVGSRVRDARFQVPAFAYLGLALVHAILFEASPDHLFEVTRHPAAGAPAVLAVALAAIVVGVVRWSSVAELAPGGVLSRLDPVLTWLRTRSRAIDVTAFVLATILAAYAASLGILELFQAIWSGGAAEEPFEWGHVAITSLWSFAGLAAALITLRFRSEIGYALALSWLALTVGKVMAFDVVTLTQTRYGISVLVVGTAVLLAGLTRQLFSAVVLTAGGVVPITSSLALLLVGALALVPDHVGGIDGNGITLAGIGALYAALGAGAFTRANQRDLSTLLWALGLPVVAVGEALMMNGAWLVLAYTVGAAALAALSVVAGERRLQVASLVYLVLGAGWALVGEAPPSHLVSQMQHPGDGLPSLGLVIGATATLAWSVGRHGRYRLYAVWAAGALAVYAASIAILEAAQRVSPESVHTDFQRGHTVVSAFWGLLALVSLYVGLRRRHGLLRGGGFLLFAISLGKIFLFDLPSLSSAQRALSFLAVGAVLLLGGFFYQRLSSQFDER